GDDAPAADGMFFKFVSSGRWQRGMSRADGMKLLSEGQLYVARWFPEANDANVDRGSGEWIPLNMRDPEALAFTTKWIETNIVPANGGNLRQFRVPRAEDCEVIPGTARVLISLTSARGRPADPAAYGVVRLLQEGSSEPDDTSFRWVDLLEGGQEKGFASPDNLAFSSSRELWIVTDISSSSLNRAGRGFEWHMNNAMFYVPLRGPNAMTAFRFANGPVEAELTGPAFNMAEQTLFLAVQHPGEETPNRTGASPSDPQTFSSWWPGGNRTAGTGTPGKPRPSVVAIRKR
ncbi:MAG: alkaline phosphatase PhoX, partial [Gaiellaceae bacterium]